MAWNRRATTPSPVERARSWMEQHYADADCLEAAHAGAGVSRNTLIAHFRKAHGLTPARFLWRLRTERGMAMLGETGLPINEIATCCGFSDPFHFTRLVRNLQGVAPRQLRERLWAGRP